MGEDERLELALRGLGAEYDRQCTQDPDRLWQTLRDGALERHGGRRTQRWRAAAAALVAILVFAGAAERLLVAHQEPAPSVDLTLVPPRAPLRVTYRMLSSYREVAGASRGGAQATVTTIRAEEKITEVFTPKPKGGYVLTVRIDSAETSSGGGPFGTEYPPGTPTPVLTYVVGPSGRVLSASATPASARAMLYKGKVAGDALMPAVTVPARALKVGDTWTAALAGGKATYTYEGVAGGLLKVHASGVLKVADSSSGEIGTETVVANDYLDPTTHILDRMTSRSVFVGRKPPPDSGAHPPVTQPDHQVFQMTWRRVR